MNVHIPTLLLPCYHIMKVAEDACLSLTRNEMPDISLYIMA